MIAPVIAPDVAEALARGAPVVALESTIIAHGMPFPDNLALARELEAAVRRGDATPATIAVLGGVLRVGLGDGELAAIAERANAIAKATAVDLAVHVASGGDAATTVSATAVIAARAGIRVFATGGIGGVHRGGGGDVSHDLDALARTPIAVVSAGAKAILDLPATLELLESLGVLVVGYRTAWFPAFYTRSAGLALDHHRDDLADIAAIVRARWALGQGGALICNPIPADAELPPAAIDAAIELAIADAAAAGITGKALTPFLLARLAELTAGRSIAANRALAIHDAEVAAALARALVV